MTTVFNLTVMAGFLNGRGSPSSTGTLVFPAGSGLTTGFKMGDILKSNGFTMDTNGVTRWYSITECIRAGVAITIPNPVYASDGGTQKYLRLDSITEETDPTPVPIPFPNEIWIAMELGGELRKYTLVV